VKSNNKETTRVVPNDSATYATACVEGLLSTTSLWGASKFRSVALKWAFFGQVPSLGTPCTQKSSWRQLAFY